MDRRTASYYTEGAADIAQRYESVPSPVERYFLAAFLPGARVLDIGCGSGRDLARLLAHGCDAYGLEPVAGLREAALAAHPELGGRLAEGALPATGVPFGGAFDGILCSAVLMHVPDTELLDAALAVRSLLKAHGRLLLSLPATRGEALADHRDAGGRLFSPYSPEEISLLFERLGFLPIGRWDSSDALGRSGTSWCTLLLERHHAGVQRPIDQIEAILNRDRKESTYKFALIRALAEIALQESRAAVWLPSGEVGVPIHRIAERWLLYCWPLFAHRDGIPQSRAEGTGGKALMFRRSMSALMEPFSGMGAHGGLTAWGLARGASQLDGQTSATLRHTLSVIAAAIKAGPVVHAGGTLESGPAFRYERSARLVVMPVELWREFSLLGHWIADAVVVRWAALTEQLAHRQGIGVADVLPLLLAKPESARLTEQARRVYRSANIERCTWSHKKLGQGFVVDHAIPFSLWGNNDLWNLLPADARTNLSKSDKLPTVELLEMRRPQIEASWSLLREHMSEAFDQQAARLLGERLRGQGQWGASLFARIKEAIEITALQRGVERWAPDAS